MLGRRFLKVSERELLEFAPITLLIKFWILEDGRRMLYNSSNG